MTSKGLTQKQTKAAVIANLFWHAEPVRCMVKMKPGSRTSQTPRSSYPETKINCIRDHRQGN